MAFSHTILRHRGWCFRGSEGLARAPLAFHLGRFAKPMSHRCCAIDSMILAFSLYDPDHLFQPGK